MSNLKISIATEFLGKGLKDADKGVKGLEKSVKNLGYLFGGGYLGAKVLAFGKSSVNAFIADDKAATQLTQTMKNLGLQLSAPSLSKFIDQMTLATGVSDSLLRPAMQGLLQTTGSLAKSQEILAQALDVSASTGVDLLTVSNDLSQAYVGNTRGLRKYNLGLTQAELKTASFADIQKLLTDRFGGANEAALDTYAGKMQVLTNAAAEAKEVIGEGLVNAISKLGGTGSNNIDNVTKSMNQLATVASGVVNTFADVFQAVLNPIGFYKAGMKTKSYMSGTVGSALTKGAAIDTAKAEKAAVTRNKQLLALKNSQNTASIKAAALAKENAILAKASALLNQSQNLFDMDRIELAAAAQGKLSEEDKVRVKLKQDILNLEDAIQNKNLAAVASWSAAIVQDSQKLAALRGDMNGLSDVNNPFTAWLESLNAIAAELQKILNMKKTDTAYMELTKSPTYSTLGSETGSYGGFQFTPIAGAEIPQVGQISINVQGSVTTERDLVATITNALYNNQASGVPVNYSTRY